MAIITESFEGLSSTPNSPALGAPFNGFLQVGAQTDFVFRSGLILVDPVPNIADGDGRGLALVGDFDLGGADTSWELGFNGAISDDGDVEGSAYLGRDIPFNGTLTFAFDKKVFSVGAAVTGFQDVAFNPGVGIAAYDAKGRLLSASHINSVDVGELQDNMLFVNSKKPIAKVVITGSFPVVDFMVMDTEKGKTAKGGNGNDKLAGSADLIFGKGGNDKIQGGSSHNSIFGDAGNDKLRGGAGDDMLSGGSGNDKLWGQEGEDSFLMGPLDGIDTLKDFNPDDDTILLPQSIFTELDLGHIRFDQFDDGDNGINPETRLIYEFSTGKLSYDPDGDGPTAAIQFAKLAPGLDMGRLDFFVV